jgi:mono/diheme cytochrome c family protein
MTLCVKGSHWAWRAIALALTMAGTSACDEKLRDVTGPSPNLAVTFSSIRAEILETTDQAGRTSCITCHTDLGRQPAGGLNMRTDAYAALVNRPSREKAGETLVIPGDPDNSYLVRKIEGGPNIALLRMPANGPPYLTPGQILVIRRWIENGAPRD